MKIIILHGSDTTKSYERLTRFVETAKKRGWEIIYDDLGVTESLFGNDKLIIIRDTKIITQKALKSLSQIAGTLVIYSEKNLPATFLKILPVDTKIEKFELPQKLWNFLGNITVKSLHEIIKTEPIEFIFIMIAWKFKKKYLSNPSEDIAQMINKLAEIDFEVKTGKADLLTSLDLFIIKNLQ